MKLIWGEFMVLANSNLMDRKEMFDLTPTKKDLLVKEKDGQFHLFEDIRLDEKLNTTCSAYFELTIRNDGYYLTKYNDELESSPYSVFQFVTEYLIDKRRQEVENAIVYETPKRTKQELISE